MRAQGGNYGPTFFFLLVSFSLFICPPFLSCSRNQVTNLTHGGSEGTGDLKGRGFDLFGPLANFSPVEAQVPPLKKNKKPSHNLLIPPPPPPPDCAEERHAAAAGHVNFTQWITCQAPNHETRHIRRRRRLHQPALLRLPADLPARRLRLCTIR